MLSESFHLTFSECFYRRTFYNMLPHRHPQNILRMLQLKLPFFVNIPHYKTVLEKCSGIVGLNNILKTFSACHFDSVLPLLSYNIVGKFYKKRSLIRGLKGFPGLWECNQHFTVEESSLIPASRPQLPPRYIDAARCTRWSGFWWFVFVVVVARTWWTGCIEFFFFNFPILLPIMHPKCYYYYYYYYYY